jgi:hypothetical protein
MSLVEALRARLGLPSAPLVLRGLGETDRYFREWLKLDPLEWIDYIRGIDFHKPVERTTVTAGTKLVRYEPPDMKPKPFIYFTRPGTSPHSTGTSFPIYRFVEYRFVVGVTALRSYASDMKFGPHDPISRPGGAVQFIIRAIDAPAASRMGRSVHGPIR